MVERQLEDVIEVLRQEEGGVSVGPEDATIGHHHGEDGTAGQETFHWDVLQSGPFMGYGRHLSRQQDPLWVGGEGGGGGRVRDEEQPGEQPDQEGETAQTVEYESPVLVVVRDVGGQQGGEHTTGLAPTVDQGGQATSLWQRLPPGDHHGQAGHHQPPRQPVHHLQLRVEQLSGQKLLKDSFRAWKPLLSCHNNTQKGRKCS